MQFTSNQDHQGAPGADRAAGQPRRPHWLRILACLAALAALAGAGPGQSGVPGMPRSSEMPNPQPNRLPDAVLLQSPPADFAPNVIQVALDLNNDFLPQVFGFVKIQQTVNAPVCAFAVAFFERTRSL